MTEAFHQNFVTDPERTSVLVVFIVQDVFTELKKKSSLTRGCDPFSRAPGHRNMMTIP